MNYAVVPAFDQRPSAWSLLHQVYHMYRDHHRKFAAITIPAALFAAFVLSLSRSEAVYLAHEALVHQELLYSRLHLVETQAAEILGYFLSWFFGCFAFAATADGVRALLEPGPDEIDVADAYSKARQRIGAIFVFAVLTFSIAAVGSIASFRIAAHLAFGTVNRNFSVPVLWILGTGCCLVVYAFLTRYALAIPKLMDSQVGIWAAMKSTVTLTDGYDGYLFLLTVESIVGTAIGAYVGAEFAILALQRTSLAQADWTPWVIVFTAALGSAFVQPPMFIGFSLLYLEQTRERDPRPIASASFLPGPGGTPPQT